MGRSWIPPNNYPIERIRLAVQKFGDQLCVVPLHCLDCNCNVNDGRDDMDEVEGSAAIAVAEAVPAGAGSQNGAIKSLESEILFSQQFLFQQRLED